VNVAECRLKQGSRSDMAAIIRHSTHSVIAETIAATLVIYLSIDTSAPTYVGVGQLCTRGQNAKFVSRRPPKPAFDVLAAAAPASLDRGTFVLALIGQHRADEEINTALLAAI
jgi:hypothetical protein